MMGKMGGEGLWRGGGRWEEVMGNKKKERRQTPPGRVLRLTRKNQ
jgi:hypothetical protein